MKLTLSHSFKNLLLVVIGFVFTSCGIPSVHPLYEPSDLKADNSLQGVWQKSGSDTRYHIIRLGDLENLLIATGDTTSSIKAVKTDDIITGKVEVEQGIIAFTQDFRDRGLENLYLVQNESTRTAIYLVGVVELGGERYLDFKLLKFDLDAFSYPVHLFMKATVSDDTLNVHMFSENWLKEQIRNQQIRIKYEVNDEENYLLTAPTSDLQKFVEKYGGIEEAYRSTNSYIKISDQPVFNFDELEESIDEK